MNEEEEKIIFQFQPSLAIIFYYSTQYLYTGLLLYFIYCFDENPIVISIIILFVLAYLFMNSCDGIILNKDRIVFNQERFINKFSTKQILYLSEIDLIKAKLPLTAKRHLFQTFSHHAPYSHLTRNMLTITYKTGVKQEIVTHIYKQELLKIFDLIKEKYPIEIIVLK